MPLSEDTWPSLPLEEAVRTANSPAGMLLEFLRTTYGAAADLAGWPRFALEVTPLAAAK
jgi:hypothetical protein